MDGGGDHDGGAAGKARVRAILLADLAGLVRPRRVGAADHAAALERLAERLAYMGEEALRGLAVLVLTHAGRVARGAMPVCPDPGTIIAWAYALQAPPPRSNAYVLSLLRSRLGEEARAGGWLLALYREALRMGPPPPASAFAKDRLRAVARDLAALQARVEERIAAGMGRAEDRAHLEAWHRDLALAEALVAEGVAHRSEPALRGAA
jgi:hypothetical protein